MSASRAVYELRINEVINYVEAHYDQRLLLQQLASVSKFSPFHFHRIFQGAVGETPRAYVTRIRLEKAIAKLEFGPKQPLLDIALSCGFSSGADFSKRFKQRYGFSPRQFSREHFSQNSKIRQELWDRSHYDEPVKNGDESRNPDGFRVTVEERPAMRLAYVRVIGGYKPERIVAGLEKLLSWGRSQGLIPGAVLIGRSKDNPDVTPASKYRFDWCLVVPADLKNDRQVNFTHLAQRRFGVLRCQGDIKKLYRAWVYLYRTWLPDSGYQPADEAAMEVFLGDYEISANPVFDLECCLPIQPLTPEYP